MPKGIALTIGLNSVDPGHYDGWSGPLNACEADAKDMAHIAELCSFETNTLLTTAATREAVITNFHGTAAQLVDGDIFMLCYSGHGGKLPDWNNDEPDKMDETWCLYDGELVDDEIYHLLGGFKEGVRIIAFSDSCHSGTVLKLACYASSIDYGVIAKEAVYRNMPREVALRTYRKNKEFYDPILKNQTLKDAITRVKASAILISGCQDNQYSMDGDFNGLFTATLLRVWNEGKFKGDYRYFHKTILENMPPDQSPNFFRVGSLNPAFERQRPFSIEP